MALLDSFRAARWLRTFNLALQAVLVLTFVLGLNYAARNHPWRFDLTAGHRFTLSAQTTAYLRDKITRPVHLIVTLPENSDKPAVASALIDVRGLLREYVIATEDSPNGRITVEYLNVDEQLQAARLLKVDEPNVIYLKSGEDRQRVVRIGELYRVSGNNRVAFLGEQAITPALLDVASSERKKIYFLTGHQEMGPDDVNPARGLSALRDQLRLLNYDLAALDFTTTPRVPDDASLIIAAAPRGVKPAEVEQLRQYLSDRPRPGSMIVILEPGQNHGLEKLLLDDWGIEVDDDLICDTDPGQLTEHDDLLLGLFEAHPVTQNLINYQIRLPIGPARSVDRNIERASRGDLSVTTLAATARSAWGERNFLRGQIPVKGPGDYTGHPWNNGGLGVIIASERKGATSELNFSVPRGRLVVFGGDAISNDRLNNPANQMVIFGAINWTVNRDTQLNVPARPITRFQLVLDQQELVRLRYSLLFIVPGITAMLGLLVYWTRRN